MEKSTMRMKIKSNRRKNQRGNALMEFAICSFLIMMLTAGVTEFSRSFSAADMAASAAEAGAQYGALSPAHWSDYAGMQAAALNDANNMTGVTATASNTCYCQLGGIPVTCPASCSSGSPITYVTVQVTVPFTSILSLPYIPTTPTLTSTNSVRVQ